MNRVRVMLKHHLAVTQTNNVYTFKYNANGDRLRQIVSGVTTTYQVDLNAGLSQVLNNGSTTYLYGASRIGELQGAAWAYHLPDGLGSVRQLANSAGSVTLARRYDPFGGSLSSAGAGSSVYGFTGEQRDASGLTSA